MLFSSGRVVAAWLVRCRAAVLCAPACVVLARSGCGRLVGSLSRGCVGGAWWCCFRSVGLWSLGCVVLARPCCGLLALLFSLDCRGRCSVLCSVGGVVSTRLCCSRFVVARPQGFVVVV